MIYEFVSAAAPWVIMGIFAACSCAWMSKKK